MAVSYSCTSDDTVICHNLLFTPIRRMSSDLRVCLAAVEILERKVSADIRMPSASASTVVVAWCIVISVVAALVGEQTREHSAEQRAQCGTAGGDDGQVDFNGAQRASECVSRVVVGILVVKLLAELVDAEYRNNGDTAFIQVSSSTTETPWLFWVYLHSAHEEDGDQADLGSKAHSQAQENPERNQQDKKVSDDGDDGR